MTKFEIQLFADVTLTDEADNYSNTINNIKIYALGGNDTVENSADKVLIDGGADNDSLSGGKGTDTFIFANNSGNDIITDYSAGDIIKISSGTISDITYSDTSVTFTLGTGSITVLDGNGKNITITDSAGNTTSDKYSDTASALLAEDNFMTDDIDSIINKSFAIAEFDNSTEKTSAQNLITFAK